MNAHVCERLTDLASRLPDRAALIEPDGSSVSFSGLARGVARLSAALDGWGMGPGTHAVLLLPMGIGLYEALLGLLWGGRTAVLVDPSADPACLDEALARVGVDGLIGTRKAHLLRLRLRALRGLRLAASDGWLGPFARRLPTRENRPPDVATDVEHSPLVPPPPGEPALISFTSGTSGTPKAIGRSHAFLLAQHRVLAEHMGLGPQDVDLPTLPVFLLNSLAAGATCVLPDGDPRDVARMDPGRLLAQIRRHGVTTMSGSPALFDSLARRIRERGDPERVPRKLFVGGARVRATLVREMSEAFPEARVVVVYGSTEAEPIATIEAPEILAETGAAESRGEGVCVGRPVPDTRIRFAAPGQSGPLMPGAVGELLVAGPHVNRGYYRDADADTSNKLSQGETVWHRTGDLGRVDDLGRIWLLGRVEDQIGALLPFRVEALAETVPGVRRAALVEAGGVPVVAFEGTAAETDVARASEVERALRVPAIPVDRRHRAKVDRPALRALLDR